MRKLLSAPTLTMKEICKEGKKSILLQGTGEQTIYAMHTQNSFHGLRLSEESATVAISTDYKSKDDCILNLYYFFLIKTAILSC